MELNKLRRLARYYQENTSLPRINNINELEVDTYYSFSYNDTNICKVSQKTSLYITLSLYGVIRGTDCALFPEINNKIILCGKLNTDLVSLCEMKKLELINQHLEIDDTSLITTIGINSMFYNIHNNHRIDNSIRNTLNYIHHLPSVGASSYPLQDAYHQRAQHFSGMHNTSHRDVPATSDVSLVTNDVSVDENESYVDDVTCGICYDKKKQICIVPCGHMLCGECATRLTGKCFVCKERYTKLVKTY